MGFVGDRDESGSHGARRLVPVSRRMIRHQPAFPPGHLLPMLIASALLMQVGGNLCFQIALGYIGLGITVPLVFSGILFVGALLGRMLLNDGLAPHIIASMLIMLVAICLLSAGTFSGAGTGPEMTAAFRIDHWRVITGVAVALVSGCSYGATGVLIRRVVRGVLPVESTLIVFSSCGVLLLGLPAIYLAGWDTIQAGTMREWPFLLAAGSANALAFFSITHAFRFTNVNTLNVINASQNAMCAVGAVLIFGEHLGLLAVTGIALTGVGLVTAGAIEDVVAILKLRC